MSEHDVVSIGGVDYNKHTGMPIENSAPAFKRIKQRTEAVDAKGVHASHQRSKTLNRQFVKKKTPATNQVAKSAKRMDFRPTAGKSPQITKFAQTTPAPTPKPVVADIAPTHHPIVAKVRTAQKSQQTAAPVAKSAQELKHAALGKALLNAKSTAAQVTPKKPRRRMINVAAASLGVLLIAGYFTYVNLPNLSVRVAAAQAGIDASYPEYRPVGYQLNGPVAYRDGEVNMKFSSNSGPLAFSLSQSKSGWDSSALLEKYVDPRSEGKYATYNDSGLTIYTYGTEAAWVNGGILYTVEGSALLSSEQIRRIATSL